MQSRHARVGDSKNQASSLRSFGIPAACGQRSEAALPCDVRVGRPEGSCSDVVGV